MKSSLRLAASAVLGGAILASTQLPAISAPTTPPTLSPQNTRATGKAEARVVQSEFSQEQIQVMARSANRTVEQQRSYLERKAQQNNTYAELSANNSYDGAFFTEQGDLVVQAAPNSAAAKAAKAKGLQVRSPQRGEAKLNDMVGQVTAVVGDKVASVSPDVAADKLIVTSTAPDATRQALSRFGDAVEVRQGEANRVQIAVKGGDKVTMASGGYCSAGFPARTSSGRKVMIWAGHCVEGQSTFSVGGTKIGTPAGTAFGSYDGVADRDIGAVYIDAEDQMTTQVNGYGRTVSQADKGPWKAPVGTDMCKSGATSGITCGQVSSYNNSVTYSDNSGRTVAQVSGLGRSTVCTAPGDSGGAYVSGGYAVGMTSGGPSSQTCTFNGGYLSGKSSYFQPVTDALSYYGLTYN